MIAIGKTDVGRLRSVNQDNIFVSTLPVGCVPNVFVVADGMGGHNAGDYASKYTVQTMVEEIERSLEQNPVRILENAIKNTYKLLAEYVS